MKRDVNKKLNESVKLLKELEWAHVYHDSIRGRDYLESLPLNIGRWAGNYTFFYILNRILHDYKPKNILELGLGESSKFVSTCLDHILAESHHLIIEQNQNWLDDFNNKFQLSKRSKVLNLPMIKKRINNYDINYYQGLTSFIDRAYDLYIVDGPHGSEHFSRYNIIDLAENFSKSHEFIILFDDCQRLGEQETYQELLELLVFKEIEVFNSSYEGAKTVNLITTKKYKYINSL